MTQNEIEITTKSLPKKIWIHIALPTIFLTNAPKTYTGEKIASSTNVAGKSGSLPAEN
jgi:hypothetical protein